MRIEAVTFDVGGTLIEPWPSVGHVYAQVAAEHGMPGLDPEALNRQFLAAWRAKANFDYSRAGWSALVSRTIRGPLAPLEELSFFGALYDRFATAEVWRIYDDVVPCFEQLGSRGIRMAAISNWDERLRPLLAALRLERYFEFVLVSSEVGVHKPAVEIFQAALGKLGCSPEAVLHVGDSAEEDVEGSRKAGMRGVLLKRGGVGEGAEGIETLMRLPDELMD